MMLLFPPNIWHILYFFLPYLQQYTYAPLCPALIAWALGSWTTKCEGYSWKWLDLTPLKLELFKICHSFHDEIQCNGETNFVQTSYAGVWIYDPSSSALFSLPQQMIHHRPHHLHHLMLSFYAYHDVWSWFSQEPHIPGKKWKINKRSYVQTPQSTNKLWLG